MKKTFGILNLLLAIAILIGDVFYLTVGGLTIKMLCSCGFVVIGIVNLLYAVASKQEKLRYPIILQAGLILAMLGDYYIGSQFILGAALFALGHVCFFIGYAVRTGYQVRDLLVSAVIFVCAAAFLMFCPLLSFSEPLLRWVCLAYALIISLMTGKAVSDLMRERNKVSIVTAVGSILFFFSDLMLSLRWFGGMGTWSSVLCMATYYPAVILIAHSSYQLTSNKELQK